MYTDNMKAWANEAGQRLQTRKGSYERFATVQWLRDPRHIEPVTACELATGVHIPAGTRVMYDTLLNIAWCSEWLRDHKCFTLGDCARAFLAARLDYLRHL